MTNIVKYWLSMLIVVVSDARWISCRKFVFLAGDDADFDV